MKFYSMLGKIKLYWAIFSQFLYEMRNPDMKSVIENMDYDELERKIIENSPRIYYSIVNAQLIKEFIIPTNSFDPTNFYHIYSDDLTVEQAENQIDDTKEYLLPDYKDEMALEEEY